MPYSNTLSPFGRVIAPPGVPVLVYGTRWCAETMRVRTFLQRLGIPHEYVDLEMSPAAAARLRFLTGGSASHPTAYVGGELLVEPTLGELEWAMARAGWR